MYQEAIIILQQYGYLIVFLGSIVAGEVFIVAAAFLAVAGFFNIYLVFLVALAGTLLSDNFWYFLGLKGKKPISFCGRKVCSKKMKKRVDDLKEEFTNHYKKVLILGKFVYGIRIISLVTCGYRNVKYKTFFTYNFIGNIVWLTSVVVAGYFFGFSWDYLSRYNSYVKYIVVVGVILFFAVRLSISHFIKLNDYLKKQLKTQFKNIKNKL